MVTKYNVKDKILLEFAVEKITINNSGHVIYTLKNPYNRKEFFSVYEDDIVCNEKSINKSDDKKEEDSETAEDEEESDIKQWSHDCFWNTNIQRCGIRIFKDGSVLNY